MPITPNGLHYPAGADSPDVPRDINLLATDTDRFLEGLGDTLQEGVIAGGVISRPASGTIRITAGSAWINGDGTNPGSGGVLSKRYYVTWPQTDLAPPSATGANFRGHRVTIPVPAGGHGTSAPVLRSGVDDVSVNLDTMNATGAVGGVPAIPAGELQVGVAITDSGGVPSTGFRDRRPWARGAQRIIKRTTNAAGGSDYSFSNTVYNGTLDAVNLYPRIECSGAPLRIKMMGIYSLQASAVNGSIPIAPWIDGAVADGITDLSLDQKFNTATLNFAFAVEYVFDMVARPGTHRVGFAFRRGTNVTGSDVMARAAYPLQFFVQELLGPNADNGNT